MAILIYFMLLISLSFTAPTTASSCTSPALRLPWYESRIASLSLSLYIYLCAKHAFFRAVLIPYRHMLSPDEKKNYINAELCLMNLPAKLDLPGVRTRFDDFQAAHQNQAYMTHSVVYFQHSLFFSLSPPSSTLENFLHLYPSFSFFSLIFVWF